MVNLVVHIKYLDHSPHPVSAALMLENTHSEHWSETPSDRRSGSLKRRHQYVCESLYGSPCGHSFIVWSPSRAWVSLSLTLMALLLLRYWLFSSHQEARNLVVSCFANALTSICRGTLCASKSQGIRHRVGSSLDCCSRRTALQTLSLSITFARKTESAVLASQS